MKSIAFYLVFAYCFIAQTQAQHQPKAKTTLPFELIEDKYILIKASVNGLDTLTFYFDTGATTTLLDSKVAAKLGIEPDYNEEVQGASGAVTYRIALNQQINLPNLQIDSVHIVLDDLTRLRHAGGMHYDGIIGNDIIQTHITEVDITNRRINLYPFEQAPDFKNYTTHVFEFLNDIPIPVLPATITLQNTQKFTDNVLFDSGAGLTLLVNTPFRKEHRILEQSPKSMTSRSNNLSSSTVNHIVAIEQLEFESHTFPQMPVFLASDEQGVSGFKGYLGILGAEIINRFDYVLNYETHTLYLKPNAFYTASFIFPVSGIRLRHDEQGQVVIMDVYEGSDAYKKGLRVNDVIVAIDNKSASIHEYRRLLNQQDRNKLTVSVKTAKGVKKHSIQLKRLI
ncbi:aspartyl protease family protein [uncultured Pontibacter sp.]|uniref:aspartyl protease family protein n=1 Tax=uncultured Pontibacter sp. TaxID=453356 RepID=UPI002615AD52|nr:aspartyl protease family protein [uncultured Pontibacter sp.]